jgi:hypothetical protein
MLDFTVRMQLGGRATVSKLEAGVRFPPSALFQSVSDGFNMLLPACRGRGSMVAAARR